MQTNHSAVVIGHGSLADATCSVLQKRGIETTVTATASEALKSSPSLLFNLWYPEPKIHSSKEMSDYPRELLELGLEFGRSAPAAHASSAMINFAFLPAIYVGTDLEDHASTLRGGITGTTRTLARRFGKQGLRVTCVQAGLVDMPETQSWTSEAVKKVAVPVKRWAGAEEVAKFMVFLAVDSLYTTGQTMIIDGGLTAGITGT
jgi:NAD(P)-dependent dehydrogenase (short-subunit alcohol dehydrogenase family)